MKKIIFFFSGLACCLQLAAQQQIMGSSRPVKLSDVIALYKQTHPDYGKADNTVKILLPGLSLENQEKDYQFNRWLWYWRQHTDGNGYLVSVAKTWQEWEKAKQQAKHIAARTTGVPAAWTFVGPDSTGPIPGGVGRINVVAFHPTDSNILWVGTPGGGAWKTTNNGATWTAMTDQLPLLSISDIVFNPLNPNTVYLCTGDRDAGDYSGIGVLKSYDGGVTWHTTGMMWTPSEYNVANSMVINPLDTNSIVLATTAGMYRSYDGGATFLPVAGSDFKQVLYCPSDTNIVYATSYINYGTSPVTCAQIWRSTNGGNTWTRQTTYTSTDRITLAVTPAAPNIVLGVGSTYDPTGTNSDGLDGIYKSSDTGNTFTEIYRGGCSGNLLTWDAGGGGCGGQGWYTLPLSISPIDSNIVFTGGVNTWGSSDGGHSWTIVNGEDISIPLGATIHVDKHFMAFNPISPTHFYETNDGSIFSSYTPSLGGTWNNITNKMGIQEIYRTGVSNIASFEIVGAQDNGSNIILPGDVNNFAYGGDGMECLLDYADSTVAYASYEEGHIAMLDPTNAFPAATSADISANILGGSIEGTGNWITPFTLEPTCHTCILAGYNAIYLSTDQGNTWTNFSEELTTNTLYRVVTTLADSNTVFATEAYSQQIYYTHDGGATWTNLTAPYGGGQQISDIKIDPRDKNHIWITYPGYGSPEVVQWTSTTGFRTMSTGLPDVPVMCFAIDYLSRDMYVGTEIGVYYRDSTMTNWEPYTTGMPSVEVTDLEINYATNELWAATYGRSLWKSPKHTTTILPTPSSVMTIVPFAPDVITISPNPNHGNFTVTVKNSTGNDVTMRLIAGDGKTVWQGNGTIQGNKLDVNMGAVVPGNYIFELASGNIIDGRQNVVIY